MVRRSLLFLLIVAFVLAPRASSIEIEPAAIEPQALCGTSTQEGPFTLRASPAQISVGQSSTLSWCDPAWSVFDAGFSATRYDIYYSRGGAAYYAAWSTTALSKSLRAEASDAGVTHHFYVLAVGFEQTIAGPRAATRTSNVVSLTVAGSGCSAPAKPALSVDHPWVALGESFTLTWSSVFTTLCEGTYAVYERRPAATTWTQIATTVQGTTSLTRTNTGGVDGMIEYYVAAVGKGNVGTSSSDLSTVHQRGAPCPADTICALDGRFTVSLAAKDPRTTHTGSGIRNARNDLFGYFSIPDLTNNPDNPEVFVKILAAPNNRFWIFYGTLTDFELAITVTDTKGNRTHVYTRPGENFCGVADTGTFSQPDSEEPEAGSGTVARAGSIEASGVSPGDCDPATALCLIAGRFQVKLAATDPRTSATAPGVPNPLNNLFGFFSLPGLTSNPDNPEVFVKVLPAGAGFWVFYGGMTDFAYTVTVTDLLESREKTYTKEPYKLCGGADTAGFP